LTYRTNLGIADGNVEYNEKNRHKVITEIRKTRPEFVFLPYWEDRHPDHGLTSKLVKDSIYFSGLKKIKTGTQEYRPVNLIYYFMHYTPEARLIMDITAQFPRKIEAVMSYKSQFFNKALKGEDTYISTKAFWEFIESRARYFGFQINAEFGEPFFVEHPVKIANLYKIFA
jgi:bacillithiol biosynthesis deacetylase BshB1